MLERRRAAKGSVERKYPILAAVLAVDLTLSLLRATWRELEPVEVRCTARVVERRWCTRGRGPSAVMETHCSRS